MECFVIHANELEGRIDPSPYHPVRLGTIKTLKSAKVPLLPLKEVADFNKKTLTSKPKNLRYIGLENIESGTGIYLSPEYEKTSFGTALSFEKGDILFPKLRPYLNKVHLAEFEGVCSTEFHVLKAKKCNNSYLFAFLNSALVVNQTSHLMTGNTLPRLQRADIENLLIPVPPPQTQNKIAGVVEERRKKAEQLRKEAKEELEKAKQDVEKMILGK